MRKAIFVGLLLLLAGLGFAAEWAFVPPAAYEGPQSPGPLHQSKLYVVSAPVVAGRAQVPILLTEPKGALAVVLGDKPSGARVRGKVLPRHEFNEPELETMDLAAEGVRFELTSLAAGEQSLVLEGLAKERVDLVVAEPESPVSLALQVRPLAARSGETLTVTAQLEDAMGAPSGQVVVHLASGGKLVLRDDGEAPDALAGDGVFTGVFVAPEVVGMQPLELRAEAKGRRRTGEPFARVASAAVMVTKPVGGLDLQGLQANVDSLTIPLLPAQGRFRVEVLYVASGMTFAWAQEEVALAGGGAQVQLPRPPETWGADRAVVRLLNLDSLGVEAEVELPLTPLAAPPDLRASAAAAQPLPASKAEAARRFGERP